MDMGFTTMLQFGTAACVFLLGLGIVDDLWARWEQRKRIK